MLTIVCGSLQPGADGVGDYSRLLAAACCRLGVPASLLALHDSHVNHPNQSPQAIEGLSVPALRLPGSLPWLQRSRLAQSQLQAWHSQALSLQFVPYGFHRRGVPWRLPSVLRSLIQPRNRGQPPRSLHLMFHEIWIGLSDHSNLKSRLVGRLQRALLHRLVQSTNPCLVHTTNQLYLQSLASIGIEAQLSLLYSNLPIPQSPEPPDPHYLTACLFGRIPPAWDPEPVLQVLMEQAARQGRIPRLRLLGRSHRSDDWLSAIRRRWPSLTIQHFGSVDCPAQLARQIQSADVGLATTPWLLIEKSGAVAAFLALGVPVVVSRNDWQPRLRGAGSAPQTLPVYANLFPLDHWGHTLPQNKRSVHTPDDVAVRLIQGLALSSPPPTFSSW
jgi:hypothetical protein